MIALIIGVMLCGVGLILSIGGTIELIIIKSLRNKKVFRIHYHALGNYATIVYAGSPADAVRRFYEDIDQTHYYNIVKVERIEEFE